MNDPMHERKMRLTFLFWWQCFLISRIKCLRFRPTNQQIDVISSRDARTNDESYYTQWWHPLWPWRLALAPESMDRQYFAPVHKEKRKDKKGQNWNGHIFVKTSRMRDLQNFLITQLHNNLYLPIITFYWLEMTKKHWEWPQMTYKNINDKIY